MSIASPDRIAFRRPSAPRRATFAEENARADLGRSPYLALRGLDCRQETDGLHIVGSLPTWFLKQMAQETLLRVDGIGPVVNDVVVDARGRLPTRRIRAWSAPSRLA